MVIMDSEDEETAEAGGGPAGIGEGNNGDSGGECRAEVDAEELFIAPKCTPHVGCVGWFAG